MPGSRPSLARITNLFLRAGNLTFGGGDPTMAVLQREMVERRGWITAEQYGAAYSLARVTPGTNVAAFCAGAAWYLRGWRGAVAAVLALTAPSAVLVIWLTHFYDASKGSTAARGLMTGAVAAAVGMMLASAWLLLRPHLRRKKWPRALIFAGGAAVLMTGAGLSPITVLALAGLAGYFWSEDGA